MNYFICTFALFALFFLSSCNSGSEKNSAGKGTISTEVIFNTNTASGDKDDTVLPKMKFETMNYDFGVVIEGEKVVYTYNFENVGGSDLIISNVEKSCGCTVPKWSKEPVKPGQKGEIEIIFDSSGKSGSQYKTITVFANTQPNTTRLSFTANVIKPGK